MNFDQILEKIKTNKENHDQGNYNCIPFEGFDRLEHILPGIEKSTYYIITSGTGTGKSKLVRSLFIHQPLEYVLNNPDKDIKLDILYFSLEESKEKIILAEISKYLFTKHGVIRSVKELQSVGRYNTISPKELLLIAEAREHVESFLSRVRINSTDRNPTGIYKVTRNFALEIGCYYKEDGSFLSKEEIDILLAPETPQNREIKSKVSSAIRGYRTYHNNHYVLIIIDHISLISLENHLGNTLNLRESIGLLSNHYLLRIRDTFGFSPVVVQQQMATKEAVEVNYRGETIEQKLEPSMDGLADAKHTSRDANIVLGLFAPHRFGIKDHYGYNINILKDNYRSLALLKSRDGESNVKVPLFFNGASDYFKILPRVDDAEGMDKVYSYIKTLRKHGS